MGGAGVEHGRGRGRRAPAVAGRERGIQGNRLGSAVTCEGVNLSVDQRIKLRGPFFLAGAKCLAEADANDLIEIQVLLAQFDPHGSFSFQESDFGNASSRRCVAPTLSIASISNLPALN